MDDDDAAPRPAVVDVEVGNDAAVPVEVVTSKFCIFSSCAGNMMTPETDGL